MFDPKEKKRNTSHPIQERTSSPAKRPFVKPELVRHERLHQVARFGSASSIAGLQSVGVAS